jgi:hypothetical protein
LTTACHFVIVFAFNRAVPETVRAICFYGLPSLSIPSTQETFLGRQTTICDPRAWTPEEFGAKKHAFLGFCPPDEPRPAAHCFP